MTTNLTLQFRSQPKIISTLVSFDYVYVNAETAALVNRIKQDVTYNRVQEYYNIYLYGEFFANYKKLIESYVSNGLRLEGIVGCRMVLFDIGTPTELATYPTLKGVRVQISTIN